MNKQEFLLSVCFGVITSTAIISSPLLGNDKNQSYVEPCGSKPNCISSAAFTQSESQQPSWYIEPLGYEQRIVSAQQAFDTLVALLEAEGFDLEINYPEIQAVATTRLFKFQDDLHFVLKADQGIVHIRSESRKGHYDFGKNRRRLESIRNKFTVHDF